MRTGIIYKLESPSGKIYVGQTRQEFKSRLSKHKSDAFNIKSRCYNYPLYRAIRKYGLDSFKKEIVFDILNLKELDKKELEYQTKYSSFNLENGYNLFIGGKTSLNFTEEQKYKMGSGKRGKILSKETREKMSKGMKGIKRSEESRQLMKITNKYKGKVNGISVNRYDLEGNLIKKYSSMAEAEKDGFDYGRISLCVREKIKIYKESIWKYD